MAEEPTTVEINEKIKRVEEAIEKHKRENKKEYFVALTGKQIENKLKRAKSPMIVSQSWTTAQLGGRLLYDVNIHNPDPTSAHLLYAHVWVGSGNVDPNVGSFLRNVDTRFPRLTGPPFSQASWGLSLEPDSSAYIDFELRIPGTVEVTNYLGNTCLMQLPLMEDGTYLDRSVFVFSVSFPYLPQGPWDRWGRLPH